MTSSKVEKLILRYLNNQASITDLDELESWIQQSSKNEKLFNSYVKTNYAIDFNTKKFNAEKVKKKLLELKEKELNVVRLRRKRRIFYSAAAVVTGLLVTTIVLRDTFLNTPKTEPQEVIVNTNEIIPGSDKAILTLEDGSSVELNKETSFQNQTVNSDGSQIIYTSSPKKSSEIKYNYLTIPRGGQYFLKLADGTSVWLNSESQLKYPVSFIEGETRKVALIYGEAYFDVSPSSEHNGSKFIVSNQFQNIEVTGTSFNIQAYKDEAHVYTTLVEGKVSVNTDHSTQNLEPNQQCSLDTSNKNMSVYKVDVKSVISWKNGLFSFRGKPLKDIAKVLARWYDIDIIFENKALESLKFKGSLDKNQSIEEILSIMKSNTINNYQIIDKTIIIK